GSETNMLTIEDVHHEETQINMVFYGRNQPMNDLLDNVDTHQNAFQENTTFCNWSDMVNGINRPYNNNQAEYNISNYNKYDNLMMNSESTCYKQFRTNMFCDLDALNRINNSHNQFEHDNNNGDTYYKEVQEDMLFRDWDHTVNKYSINSNVLNNTNQV
ncbi:46219_t:CDS:1, partial [Gigaspora margarita]